MLEKLGDSSCIVVGDEDGKIGKVINSGVLVGGINWVMGQSYPGAHVHTPVTGIDDSFQCY